MNNKALISVIVLSGLLSAKTAIGQKISAPTNIIDYVLLDTLNPELYLVPLNVKFSNSDSIWVGYSNVYNLFEFCKKKYGWNRETFIHEMRTLLSSDKALEIDTNFGSPRHYILKSDCKCLYNDDSAQLKQILLNKKLYKPAEKSFCCFVYRCFKANIPLGWIEGELQSYILPKPGD